MSNPVSVGNDLVERYAVRADELSEGGQYAWWTELAALLRLQAYQLGEAMERAEVAEYKLGNVVNIIQPATLIRATTAEAQLKAARDEMEQTTELMLLADRFKVGDERGNPIWVVSRGPSQWAVFDGAFVLNSDDEWEPEPLPSNRDDDFISRTRFTFAAAITRARAALNPKAPS